MDSEIQVEFDAVVQKSESLVEVLKNKDKPASVTSDYAEEDIASSLNSISTSNTATVHDVFDTTQDVKPSSTTELTAFTPDYLNACIKNLLTKLDHFKVNLYDVESWFSEDKEAIKIMDLCRKRLTSIIMPIEEFNIQENSFSHLKILCQRLDYTYRSLCVIKEQLLKLNLRTSNIIIKIDSISNYANNHIRNIVLALDESNVKSETDDDCTIVCELEYSKNENKSEVKMINDFPSDSECKVLKEVVIKIQRLQNIKTNPFETKEVSSSVNNEISDTDGTIFEDADSSSSNTDLSYNPLDDFDSSNLSSSDSDSTSKKAKKMKKQLDSLKKKKIEFEADSQKSITPLKKNKISRNKILIKHKRSNCVIESDSSDESEDSAYRSSKILVRNKEKLCRRLKSTSKKLKLQTTDESDTENNQEIPTNSNKITINDDSKGNHSIDVANISCQQKLSENPSSSNNIQSLCQNENSKSTDQLLEECDSSCADCNESESEVIYSGSDDQIPRPKKVYSARVNRKHKVKLIGIRNYLRSLL